MSTNDYRLIRRYAYEMLFSLDFHEPKEVDQLFFEVDYEDEDSEDLIPKSKLSDEQKALIFEKVQVVLDHLADIDERIEKLSDGWKLNRIGKEEITAIRLALAENMYMNIDKSIVIDEAVRLMKIYGGDNSARFVNGVLGTI